MLVADYILLRVVRTAKIRFSQNRKTSTPTPIEREIIALKRQVADLRADNDALRAEVTTLTSQNGVVDTIITHLRELKAQDQAIIGLIQPGGNGYSASLAMTGSSGRRGGFRQCPTSDCDPEGEGTTRSNSEAGKGSGSERRRR
ncbi:hypothetical protein HED49_23625 [Ochrobactrum daejeonense]|nr:hypothetical protein [Brucella daejeonensis]